MWYFIILCFVCIFLYFMVFYKDFFGCDDICCIDIKFKFWYNILEIYKYL